MNYRHIYHAGNFADIIKHLVLINCLNEIAKKDKPYAVLDAFAGIGLYDLSDAAALKTNESSEGIFKLIENRPNDQCLFLIQKLIDLNKAKTDHYCGSPKIIEHFLRKNDRLIACELHKQDYQELAQNFKHSENVYTYQMDAYTATKAHLPFKEKRGLVLIDPPFEVRDEFDKIIQAMELIYNRARNLCTIVWFPIKESIKVKNFYEQSSHLGFAEILKIEFELGSTEYNLNKCGILVFNPPNIIDQLKVNLSYLTQIIYKNKTQYNLSLL